jgi:hypothetical protein
VNVKKPTTLRLYTDQWEIRAYVYSGLNCYTTGGWWQSGNDWIYSGWYEHRFTGDDWTLEEETRTFNIRASVVNVTRSETDKSHGMEDIPVGSYVTLRIRLLISDVSPTFSGETSEGSGMVSFTIGGTTYRYPYLVDQYGTIMLSGQSNLNAQISQDTTGEWRLVVDLDSQILVTNQAESQGTLYIPSTLEVNLSSFSAPETSYSIPQELQIALSFVVVLAAVGAGAYLGLRKKGEELPPE